MAVSGRSLGQSLKRLADVGFWHVISPEIWEFNVYTVFGASHRDASEQNMSIGMSNHNWEKFLMLLACKLSLSYFDSTPEALSQSMNRSENR